MLRFYLTILSLCFAVLTQAQAQTQTSQTYSFKDVTKSHLPKGLVGRCMDTASHDFDKDGDIDIMLAMEFSHNLLLINNGKGKFTLGADMPKTKRDSEDIAVADFNGDGNSDVIIVSEDDRTNEYYLNQGAGKFIDVSERLPLEGESNAIVTADINGDGAPDVLIGNVGRLGLLINDGKGNFIDESKKRLPYKNHRVQDLALVDIDNDGDLDILTADEVLNRILINNGKGVFTNETKARFPNHLDMTREVITADVDNDGDIDIFYANVANKPEEATNRLLINNLNNQGLGYFSDASQTLLPTELAQSNFTARFTNLNNDNHPDLLVPSSHIKNTNNGAIRFYINDGKGAFKPIKMKTPWPTGNGFDVAEADFNGDGIADYYLCNRARRGFSESQGGFDRLMFGVR